MNLISFDELEQIERIVELSLKVKLGCVCGTGNHEKAESVIEQCLDKLLEEKEDE